MSDGKSQRDAIHDVLEDTLKRIRPEDAERGITASAIITFFLALGLGGVVIWQRVHIPQSQVETLDARMERLTKSLLEASDSISEIEREIELRQQFAKKLKSEADQAQHLKDLNAAQVAAVAQAVRGQMDASNNAGWWQSIGLNLFFAFFGAFVSELIRIVRERQRKNQSAASEP